MRRLLPRGESSLFLASLDHFILKFKLKLAIVNLIVICRWNWHNAALVTKRWLMFVFLLPRAPYRYHRCCRSASRPLGSVDLHSTAWRKVEGGYFEVESAKVAARQRCRLGLLGQSDARFLRSWSDRDLPARLQVGHPTVDWGWDSPREG